MIDEKVNMEMEEVKKHCNIRIPQREKIRNRLTMI